MIRVFGIDIAKKKDFFALILNPSLRLSEYDLLDWYDCSSYSKNEKNKFMNKVIRHGKRLGKQMIENPIIACIELRYAKIILGFNINPQPMIGYTKLKIPIPFMKKDHGLIIRFYLF